MKTSFRQRNKLLYKAATILAFALILFAVSKVASENFRSQSRDFFAGTLNFSSKIRNFIGGFGSGRIFELESKNAELLGENSILQERVSELESGIVNFDNQQKFVARSALILSRAPSAPYDTILIDFDFPGIAEIGTKVIAHKGIYIGEISEIGKRAAMIKLLSYPSRETEAWLERAGINITLVGEGGYNFNFSVPKDVLIEAGDRVLSNTDPQFLIGMVEKIGETPTNPLKEIKLRFPFNFNNLRYVELID